MGELHTGQKQPLSGADPEFYFVLHMVPPGYQPKGKGDCGYLAQYSQAYSRWVGLISLGCQLTLERGAPIINPWVGETRQPWLATHLGEGKSEFKPMVRGICWHCPSLLGIDS